MQRHDAGIASRFVSLRRQRAVCRGALRGLSRQSGIGSRALARRTSTSCSIRRHRTGATRSTCRTRRSSRRSRSARATAASRRRTPRPMRLATKQVYVQQLIAAYRFLGARWANLDPLKRQERPSIPELEPAFYDFTEADMATIYPAPNTYFGFEEASLREIVKALRETYCGSIGAEFMYVSDPQEKRWMQERLESIRANAHYDPATPQAHPRPADGRRGPRALSRDEVRRPEALLARRRRELHPVDRRMRAAARQPGRPGDRHRHGPPRPAERAGQRPRQDAERPVRRVRGQARRRPAVGRRQVPQGLLVGRVDAGRTGAPVARVQPVAPGDRQSGRRGLARRRGWSVAATPTATRSCRSSSTATPRSRVRAS